LGPVNRALELKRARGDPDAGGASEACLGRVRCARGARLYHGGVRTD
jgi:hypothetical protein